MLWWGKSHELEGKTSGRSWRLQNCQATNLRYCACPSLQKKGIGTWGKRLGSNLESKGHWALHKGHWALHVEGTRFWVKHKAFSAVQETHGLSFTISRKSQADGNLICEDRDPQPSAGTDWWHRVVTSVQCTNRCSHKCPAQSGWSHAVCTALPNLLL